MKTSLLLLFLLTSFFANSQFYIDMTNELSNVKENLVIDGNTLKINHNTREEIIITGKNLKLNNNSGIILNNLIIQLSGNIIIEEDAKVFPKLINSYIFCRSSENWNSKYIIEKSNTESVDISKVKSIKKIKGNPKITIYDSATGTRVYSGYKDNSKGKTLSISRYDLKVDGGEFLSNLLFY